MSYRSSRTDIATANQARTDRRYGHALAALTPEARNLPAGIVKLQPRRGGADLETSSAASAAQAGTEIGRQIATDVLIIEDGRSLRSTQRILEGLGHRVVRSCVRTRMRWQPSSSWPGAYRHRLADGSSASMPSTTSASFTLPVVFVTAYPERLTTGHGPEPTFLIPKPFRDDAVAAIVSQVLFFDQEATRRPSGRSAPAAP
jgi:hypothetical protein